jgi:hypothetical protein
MKNIFPVYLKRALRIASAVPVFFFVFCNQSTGPKNQAPVPGNGITVLTPTGGMSYNIGDPMTISWDLNMSPDSISGLEVDFSPNNGNNYFVVCIILPTYPEFQQRKFVWIIPDTVYDGPKSMSTRSNSCKIFVHDYFNYSTYDVSDRPFAIR